MSLADRVLELANNPGSNADVSLAGPTQGRASFASRFQDGAQPYYYITDGTAWECGAGTLQVGSPSVLQRTTVYANSAGNTARIGFSGQVRVFNEVPAQRMLYMLPDGSPSVGDLFPWRVIGRSEGSVSGAVAFALPANLTRFELQVQDASPAASASTALPYVQFSVNGGVSWLQGASDYSYNATTAVDATISGTVALADRAVVGGVTQVGSGSYFATIIFSSVTKRGHVESGSYTGSQLTDWSGQLICWGSPASQATNVRFGFLGQNVGQHRIRLLGGA